ncbi:putative meiosis specific protein Spo22/ZIP4/TEX11 [Septoria linicola]|nr:putative meiosis specific protein Spo22/ZIP4/TEX11 [Septoria linicola]
MAPLKSSRDDKRLEAIIDTADQALRHLRERQNVPSKLVGDIDTHVRQSFSVLSNAPILKRVKEFDTFGTEIWNGAASLLTEFEEHEDEQLRNAQIKAGVLLRLFALLLLDAAHAASSRLSTDPGQQLRLFVIANRAARLCLDRHQLDLSVTALEVGSKNIPPPVEPPSLVQFDRTEEHNLSDHELCVAQLEREFYLLRMLHAWKSERHDLADHFFLSWSKVEVQGSTRMIEASIKAADLFYEFARELTKAQASTQAMKWYDRALAAFGGSVEQVHPENAELLSSIAVAYVEELLKSGKDTDLMRSKEVVLQLEKSHVLGNRVALPVLKLRVLANIQDVDPEEIRQALVHVIKHTVLTEDNFKMILQTARKANETAPETTLSALRMLILQRILPEATNLHSEAGHIYEWLEKATITYAMYVTTHMVTTGTDYVSDLTSLFDAIEKIGAALFSAKATHAAQTLLWRATNGPNDAAARICCRLLRHPLFENSGYVNKARIGRKIMRSALDSGEFHVAREAFLAMPDSVQNEPATRYLTFQLALRQDDNLLATESLRVLVSCSNTDATYLYACVLDAQQLPGSRHMAVLSLRAILACRPPGLQLGSLLRCMARLFLVEMKSKGAERDLATIEVVSIFEMAANSAQDIRQSAVEHWYTEVQWWSKNAYNLSVELCSSIDPQQLLRLLSACIVFLDNYPKDPALIQAEELAKRKSLCLLLSVTSLVVLGRSAAKNQVPADACFVKAQQVITAFKQQQGSIGVEDEERKLRAFTVLKFELECVLHLRRWDLLESILKSCFEQNTAGRWDTLADLMIVIHEHLNDAEREAHVLLITQLLQRIINDTWRKDKNIVKVSRWLRFAFMLCMNHEKGDFAHKLLEQASHMAESGQRGKFDMYPESELQWLATTGFNHAIDLIASGQRENVKKWLDAALEVARWAQDNGTLHAILSNNRKAVEERMESDHE